MTRYTRDITILVHTIVTDDDDSLGVSMSLHKFYTVATADELDALMDHIVNFQDVQVERMDAELANVSEYEDSKETIQ